MFLSTLTAGLFGFTYWAADGFDPPLLRPVRGEGHPAWIVEPYGALALGSVVVGYVYLIVRTESVPSQRRVLLGAVTFATIFLALWPDLFGTLRFGNARVIESQIDGWIGAQALRGELRWIACGLLQLVLASSLVRRKRSQGPESVGLEAPVHGEAAQ